MSWMSGLGWKEGLSAVQVEKVEQLEKNLTRANNNVQQKQLLLDGLNQTVQKLKRKIEEDQREKGSLQHELSSLQNSCQQLEDKNQSLRSELKSRDHKLTSLQDQLGKANNQLETAHQSVKRLENSQHVVQTPTRRVSVTPHKRERESSLTIGTSADIDPYERIAVLEAKLAEKDQETKDLEVKLFESSFLPSASKTGKIFDEDAPLPSAKKNPARTLFDEEPLPTSRSADISSQNIANRHKGSSISFGYASTPPDQKKNGRQLSNISICQPESASRAPSQDGAAVSETTDHKKVSALEATLQTREAEMGKLRVELALLEQTQAELKVKTVECSRREAQLSTLELELQTRETEMGKLRVELASLEQTQAELKVKTEESSRREAQLSTIELELQTQSNKVLEFESKITKLVQENQCQIQNAESVKNSLELKLKEQEKDLRLELSESNNFVSSLNKDLEELKKQQEKERTMARNSENSLKTEIERLESDKSDAVKEVSVQRNKILQLENVMSVKERDLTECSRKLTEVTKDQELLRTASEKSEGRIADLTAELDKEKNTKKTEMEKLQQEICDMKSQVVKVQEELSVKSSELENLLIFKSESSEKIEKIDEYEKETNDARKEVESMKMVVEEAVTDKELEIQKAQQAIADKVSCEMKQWELDEKIAVLENEKVEILEQCKQLEDMKSRSADTIESLQQKIAQQMESLESLESLGREKEAEIKDFVENEILIKKDLTECKEKNLDLEKNIEKLEAKIGTHDWESINSLKEKLEAEVTKYTEVKETLEKEMEKLEEKIKEGDQKLAISDETLNQLNDLLAHKDDVIKDFEGRILEMEKSIEESNDKMSKASENHENTEKELREALDFLRVKEHDLSQMCARYTELQTELDDIQTEKNNFLQTEIELSQTISNLKTEKEDSKEFVDILQKQNAALITQIEGYDLKLRQAEETIDTHKDDLVVQERSISELNKKMEENAFRLQRFEMEEDKLAACIVELEQKCGEEKKKVIKLEDQTQNYEIHVQKLNENLKLSKNKIDDLEDMIKYDKEHVNQLETEIQCLKQGKTKLESDKQKLSAKLRLTERNLKQRTSELANQVSLLELTKIQMKRKVSRASTHPKLEELNKMLKEKTDEIETLKDLILELENVYSIQQKTISGQKKNIQHFESQVSLLKEDLVKSEILNQELVDEKETLAEAFSKLNVSLEAAETKLLEKNKELETNIEIVTELKVQATDLSISVEERLARITTLETDIYEKEVEISSLKTEVMDREEKCSGIELELQQLGEDVILLRSENEKLTEQHSNTKSETQIEIQKLLEDKRELSESMALVSNDKKDLEKQMSVLTREYDNAKSEVSFYLQECDKLKTDYKLELEEKVEPLEKIILESDEKIKNLETKLSEANVMIEKTVELDAELTEARREKEDLMKESEQKNITNEIILNERNELLLVLKEKEEAESKLNQEIKDAHEMLNLQSNSSKEALEKAASLLAEERAMFAKDLDEEKNRCNEMISAELEKLKCVEVQLREKSQENIELNQLKTSLESKVVSLETLHEEVRERLLAETEDFRDALEKKDKESSLLITELQGFNSKLLELQKKITEDTENFELKLSSSESQISELSAKNAEFETKLNAALEENTLLEGKLKKLEKQSANWKQELDKVSEETRAASQSPWEDPEWEGLTAQEKYELMREELVPAQQARLSKLCIEELEKQLEESKNLLTKVLIEKEAVRDALKKLETKLHFLTNPAVDVPSKESRTAVASNPCSTAVVDTKKPKERPEPAVSRRRSTRSASSLAHYKISEALSPSAENTKKRKTARDLSDSSREKRPNKEIVPAAEVEDRGALGCITNSPAKSSTQSRRSRAIHKDAMGTRRNPEECKQQ